VTHSRRIGAVLGAVITTAAVVGPVSQGSSRWRCAATQVRGQVVKAGVFTGYIAPSYDVVGGRFRLHVGDYRNRAIGLSQKIPWYAPVDSGVDGHLTIAWARLAPAPTRRFTLKAPTGGIYPQGYVYPTAFSPPSAGCWRLTFRSGSVTSTLEVLVSGRG
jgi:hypothetical protein